MVISRQGFAFQRYFRVFLVLGGALTLVVMGCSGRPAAVPPVTYNPEEMAAAAMAEFDKNHDGKLDASELENCPALKHMLVNLETDKTYLTEEDIADRLRQFDKSKVGLMGTTCIVTRGGVGIPDVKVTYTPEFFMGNAIKPASGISDAAGNVELKVEGESVRGVNLGFYRVEVSLPDSSGNETLPARFNTETKLGQEINNRRSTSLRIELGP
jgi:hypothetical protein